MQKRGGHEIIFSSVANANPRPFLGWYILNSIATADQKSQTKFENLEDGARIKHNLKRCKYGTKTVQTFRNQCGSAVYKSNFQHLAIFFFFAQLCKI